jgi:hypothetical protein
MVAWLSCLLLEYTRTLQTSALRTITYSQFTITCVDDPIAQRLQRASRGVVARKCGPSPHSSTWPAPPWRFQDDASKTAEVPRSARSLCPSPGRSWAHGIGVAPGPGVSWVTREKSRRPNSASACLAHAAKAITIKVLFSLKKITKYFQIPHYIESCGACMKH